MAHFAQIDENIVTNVIVISNEVLGEPDNNYPDTEIPGQEFIRDVLGFDGLWLQTSYNGSFRGVFAGIGYTYDQTTDVFIAPFIPPTDYTPPES